MAGSPSHHLLQVHGSWHGDYPVSGVIDGRAHSIHFGKPPAAGTADSETDHEELLASALAASYICVLAEGAQWRGIPLLKIDVTVAGEVIRLSSRTNKLLRMAIRPTMVLAEGDEHTRQAALNLAEEAGHMSAVANALRGHVDINVFPKCSTDPAGAAVSASEHSDPHGGL